jgi:hypothetical protein
MLTIFDQKFDHFFSQQKKKARPDLSLCNFGCIFIDFQHAVVDLKELNGLTPLHLACHQNVYHFRNKNIDIEFCAQLLKGPIKNSR